MNHQAKRNQKASTGFTLIELLVVVSIITVVLGLFYIGLGKSLRTSRQARSMTDLNQILIGYKQYRYDHMGHVLYGYTPGKINGKAVTVKLPSGKRVGAPVADRYPWRLAPYVQHMWSLLHRHQKQLELPRTSDDLKEAVAKAYTLSLEPSYGLNTIFVGGHGAGQFKGFVRNGREYKPNWGKHVAFDEVHIDDPHNLITFSEVRGEGGMMKGNSGMHFVSPPIARGRWWSVKNGKIVNHRDTWVTGLPKPWVGKRTVVGFFDGHVELRKPENLLDMRLWAPKAETADYDFAAR